MRPAWILLAAATAFGQESIRVSMIVQEQLIHNLEQLPTENPARQQFVKDQFAAAGCKDDRLTLQRVKQSKLANVVCVLPGESSDMVVVGAHFDKVKAGRGTVDNGSGVLLLPALYTSLAVQPRHHTFVFAAFTDEEKGLVGSRAFARAIPKADRAHYLAMVNIDTLGLGPATVWQDHSHPRLLDWFEIVAGALKVKDFQYVNVGKVGDGDSTSFKEVGIASIDFHSITQQTFAILHSEKDSMAAIHPDDYFASYRLIAHYLAFLDLRLKDAPNLKAKPSAGR